MKTSHNNRALAIEEAELVAIFRKLPGYARRDLVSGLRGDPHPVGLPLLGPNVSTYGLEKASAAARLFTVLSRFDLESVERLTESLQRKVDECEYPRLRLVTPPPSTDRPRVQ